MPLWLIYSLLTIACWGVWGVLPKALGGMSAGQSQAFSTLGILPVMLAVAASPGFRQGERRPWGSWCAFLAGGLVGAGNASYYQAVSQVKAATTVSFTMLYPIVTVVLAVVLLREKPYRFQVAGIAGSLAAIALLSGVATGPDAPGAWLLYALACIVLWGTAGLIMKVAARDVPPARSTFWFLAAFVPLGAWILAAQPAYFVDQPIHWNPPLRDWLVVTALGATFGVGNLTLLAAYRYGGKASIVTPLCGLYPVVTIPLAILMFSEAVGAREWAGITLAILSAAALMREPAPAAPLAAVDPSPLSQ